MGPGLGPAIFFAKERTLLDYSIGRSLKKKQVTKLPVATPPILLSTTAAQKKSRGYSNLSITAQWGLLFFRFEPKRYLYKHCKRQNGPRSSVPLPKQLQKRLQQAINSKLILAVVKLLLGCQLTRSYHQPFLNIQNSTIF